MSKKMLFIGGGNMARAIVGGLVAQGYPAEDIYLVDRHLEKRTFFFEKYHIHVSENISDFLPLVDTIILAVKPQGAKEVCLSLHSGLAGRNPLMISVMAGVSLLSLEAWLGKHLAIVRTMPNTPAFIQEGATGLFGNPKVSEEQLQQVENIFSSIGIVAKLKTEEDLNTITALSGSGPAYYFYFMESMQQVAMKMGLDSETAKAFAIQTAYGAAKLARESTDSLTSLREQVTSKKGTTAAALSVMVEHHLPLILQAAMEAAVGRAVELSKELQA